MSNKNYYETTIELKYEYINIKSIHYDKIINSNNNNLNDDKFILSSDKIIELVESIKEDKKEIKLLKDYVNKLEDESIRNIIIYRYFERKTWKEIKKITDFSEIALKYKRNKGLTKLAFMFFGYKVLDKI